MATTTPKDPDVPDEYSGSQNSKFRFKSKRSRDEERDRDRGGRRTRRQRSPDDDKTHSERRHAHRHRRKRHKSSPEKDTDPSIHHGKAGSQNHMDSQQAFRESLFDALADDEGAAYWEGVYGQPIHTYPNTKVGPEGELEQMSDEEYAAYVRGRMYEKTHQHIIEERERREEERKRRRRVEAETGQLEEERLAFDQKILESLRKGEERKAKRRWKEAWERYDARWEQLRQTSSSIADGAPDELLPWPVLSGKMKDVSKQDVETFMRNAPSDSDLQVRLKAERIQWHPDKMQQRFGGGRGVDAEVLRSITTVFQIMDAMWNELRKLKSSNHG